MDADIHRELVRRTLRALVAAPSVNPLFADASSGPGGEGPIAARVAGTRILADVARSYCGERPGAPLHADRERR